jgi:CRP-like cAMP-binding protein
MDYLHKRHYQRGEEIIRYGEPGFALYIIKEGEVSVEIPAETGTIEVDTLSVGEFFGEMALVTESPRTATIKCKTDVIIYALTRSAFEELMKVHPNIAVKILYNIAAVLAERLKKLNEQLQKNL